MNAMNLLPILLFSWVVSLAYCFHPRLAFWLSGRETTSKF